MRGKYKILALDKVRLGKRREGCPGLYIYKTLSPGEKHCPNRVAGGLGRWKENPELYHKNSGHLN